MSSLFQLGNLHWIWLEGFYFWGFLLYSCNKIRFLSNQCNHLYFRYFHPNSPRRNGHLMKRDFKRTWQFCTTQQISSPWDSQKPFVDCGFPKSSAVSPSSHSGVTLSFPWDTRSQLCPTKEGAALGGVEPCWALSGCHLSALSAPGHSSPDPLILGWIWQPNTPTFHIFQHLQQQKESGGPDCAVKQRDKGYFPKLCNQALHK